MGKESFYNSIGKLNEIEFSSDAFISDSILETKVGYGDGMSIILSDFLTDNNYEGAIDYLVDKRRDLFEANAGKSGREENHRFKSGSASS